MRLAALSLIGSLVLTAAAVVPANAAPMIGKAGAATGSNIIEVSGGCGPAYYRDAWGYCLPKSRAYYAYPAYSYPAYYSQTGWYGYPHGKRHHHRHHRHHHWH